MGEGLASISRSSASDTFADPTASQAELLDERSSSVQPASRITAVANVIVARMLRISP
jgi:hypothetical protein